MYQVSTFYASQFLIKVWRKILMFENWREIKWRNKGMNKQQQPDSGIHNTSAHCQRVYLVSIFKASQFVRRVTKNFNVWKLERKENEEIKEQIRSSSLILLHTIHLPISTCVLSFNLQTSKVLRKMWRKFLMFDNWRERKWRNKGTNKQQ